MKPTTGVLDAAIAGYDARPLSTRSKILIVDDNKNNLLALEATLERLGEEIVRAYSGEDALGRLLEEDFAVILMDVQMPGMDGFETASLIRQRERSKSTPIIFVTASERSELQIFAGYSLGAVDYLCKPIVPEILRSKVSVFIDLHRRMENIREQEKLLRQRERDDHERRIIQERQTFELSRLRFQAEKDKQIAELLSKRAHELELENQRQNEFLAMLSHELRNPLAPILHALKALRASPSDEKRERSLRILEHQIGHLTALVEDLLDVTRVRSGKITLSKEPLELVPLLTRVVESVTPVLQEKKQELILTTRRDGIWCSADQIRLEQVLLNLLRNASKYSDHGKRVEVILDECEDQVVIKVKDEGIGIEPDFLPVMFDLFSQATSSVSRAEGGLGVGLALVHRLVELQEGAISVESEGQGKGSTFTITFPKLDVAHVDSTVGSSPERGKAKGRRVLVVDDNIIATEAINMVLEDEGHEIKTAHDGAGALSAVSFDPDVVILDIGLPDIDGFEVARRLRKQLTDSYFIALTGYGMESDKAKAKEAGFDHHLVKPVDPEEIERLLQSLPDRGPALP